MSSATVNLHQAMDAAMQRKPRVGGFPYLAECLRRAGVRRNVWTLPAGQSLFLTELGPVVMSGVPLESGMADVPMFNREELIHALRVDQAGDSTFPEFLEATWRAGVVEYLVDFGARTVSYMGCEGESYVEEYPYVDVSSESSGG